MIYQNQVDQNIINQDRKTGTGKILMKLLKKFPAFQAESI